jgi:hypothetical protein
MRHFLLPIFVLLLLQPTAFAADFLSEMVPVADRSEAELAKAAQQALASVMVRVSGDERIVEVPSVADAITDARNRMSLYTYEVDGSETLLYVQFDDRVIKNLVREAGATWWAPGRPPVLLWMVIDEPYARRFATTAEDGPLLRELAADFKARGVQLRLPLLDLEDAAALSPAMVWQKVLPRITAASERYGTRHILVGRMVQLSNGKLLTDWLYLDDTQQRTRQVQGDDPTPILAEAVDMTVDAMAEQYAVVLETVSDVESVTVSIDGVRSLSDYRAVLALLDEIDILEGRQVAAIDGERLELRVRGVSDAEALARLLPSRSRLAMVAMPASNQLELVWGAP